MNAAAGALPRLVVVTDRNQAGDRGVPAVVAAAVEGGARWVLLRDRDLPPDERLDLRRRLEPIVEGAGGLLSVAGCAGAGSLAGGATGSPAAGCHLAADEPHPGRGGGLPSLVGRSCHNPEELARARHEGCAYAFLSPVFPSPSKPGYGPPLGRDRLAEWCAGVDLPVYALGGVDVDRARACLDAGAAGVAVMGAVMGADDPAAVTAAYLERLGAGAPAGSVTGTTVGVPR